MHDIRGERFFLVFEPIVDMLNNEVIGYEGLCRSELGNVNPETFFKTLSINEHFDLLSKQLQKYQKWVEQHPEIYQGRRLFLNINQELLVEDDLLALFIPYYRHYPISLELEPQYPLTCTQRLAIKSIIGAHGIPVWFDDYADGVLLATYEIWSGVKLDRHFFWSLARDSKKNITLESHFTAENLICEGVETSQEKDVALALGMRYGQGYLWPAVG